MDCHKFGNIYWGQLPLFVHSNSLRYLLISAFAFSTSGVCSQCCILFRGPNGSLDVVYFAFMVLRYKMKMVVGLFFGMHAAIAGQIYTCSEPASDYSFT